MSSIDLSVRWHDTSGMGRFGGGWQLKLGLQAGRRDWIVNLLVFSVRIRWAAA